MNDIELQAWNSFKNVIVKFLGNIKYPQYEQTVRTMLEKLQALGCNMSLKLHFLHSHLHYFPENVGALREEKGERFHEDIKEWKEGSKVDGTSHCWLTTFGA